MSSASRCAPVFFFYHAFSTTASWDNDASTTFNWITTADWGDDSAGQHACAAGMGKVAAEINAQQVFMLGDNFYPSGIHPVDGPDGEIRIKKTFEDVYTADSLQHVPFYVIAGNHDHLGNVTAQIAYSQSRATRYRFPSYWHNVTQRVKLGDKTVELEFLLYDTVIMAGNADVLLENGTVKELKMSELTGPAPEHKDLAAEQMAWLEERMGNSTAGVALLYNYCCKLCEFLHELISYYE